MVLDWALSEYFGGMGNGSTRITYIPKMPRDGIWVNRRAVKVGAHSILCIKAVSRFSIDAAIHIAAYARRTPSLMILFISLQMSSPQNHAYLQEED